MRIWKCLEFICETLEPLLEATTEVWEDWAPWLENTGRFATPAQEWRGLSMRCDSAYRFTNEALWLPMSTPSESPLRVTASLIRFNCRRYIGGLRVSYDSEDNEVISEVGTGLSGTEEHFNIATGDLLESLLVYTAPSGIVGIEFGF